MQSVLIRSGRLEDVEAILGIYNEAVRDSTGTYDIEPVSYESRRHWFETRLLVLVAELDGEVVGFGSLSPYRERAGYRFTLEHSVYVSGRVRGHGLGKRIVEALIDEARERGAHVLIGGVDGENLASVRLHESLGFVQAGRLREVGHKFDRWLDVVFFQKFL